MNMKSLAHIFLFTTFLSIKGVLAQQALVQVAEILQPATLSTHLEFVLPIPEGSYEDTLANAQHLCVQTEQSPLILAQIKPIQLSPTGFARTLKVSAQLTSASPELDRKVQVYLCQMTSQAEKIQKLTSSTLHLSTISQILKSKGMFILARDVFNRLYYHQIGLNEDQGYANFHVSNWGPHLITSQYYGPIKPAPLASTINGMPPYRSAGQVRSFFHLMNDNQLKVDFIFDNSGAGLSPATSPNGYLFLKNLSVIIPQELMARERTGTKFSEFQNCTSATNLPGVNSLALNLNWSQYLVCHLVKPLIDEKLHPFKNAISHHFALGLTLKSQDTQGLRAKDLADFGGVGFTVKGKDFFSFYHSKTPWLNVAATTPIDFTYLTGQTLSARNVLRAEIKNQLQKLLNACNNGLTAYPFIETSLQNDDPFCKSEVPYGGKTSGEGINPTQDLGMKVYFAASREGLILLSTFQNYIQARMNFMNFDEQGMPVSVEDYTKIENGKKYSAAYIWPMPNAAYIDCNSQNLAQKYPEWVDICWKIFPYSTNNMGSMVINPKSFQKYDFDYQSADKFGYHLHATDLSRYVVINNLAANYGPLSAKFQPFDDQHFIRALIAAPPLAAVIADDNAIQYLQMAMVHAQHKFSPYPNTPNSFGNNLASRLDTLINPFNQNKGISFGRGPAWMIYAIANGYLYAQDYLRAHFKFYLDNVVTMMKKAQTSCGIVHTMVNQNKMIKGIMEILAGQQFFEAQYGDWAREALKFAVYNGISDQSAQWLNQVIDQRYSQVYAGDSYYNPGYGYFYMVATRRSTINEGPVDDDVFCLKPETAFKEQLYPQIPGYMPMDYTSLSNSTYFTGTSFNKYEGYYIGQSLAQVARYFDQHNQPELANKMRCRSLEILGGGTLIGLKNHLQEPVNKIISNSKHPTQGALLSYIQNYETSSSQVFCQ